MSGRTSSEQARLDAIADAETLTGALDGDRDRRLHKAWIAINDVRQWGWLATHSGRFLGDHAATMAARAAFRACPGLRGDR